MVINTEQTFGNWQDMPAITGPHNQMVLDATHLVAHWRRCSLSSDFWARYTALFIPESVPAGRLRRSDAESVLAYLLNELFENCAKFSGGPNQRVCYQSWVGKEELIFQITNHIIPNNQPPFVKLIAELLEGDPEELYFQKLEENAELDTAGSGLGYLTLIKDYGIRFGFRFRQVGPESVAVDVQAHLTLSEGE
ncbi:MAG TPA: hypothetical protein PKE64_03945 [Anaerolineae bacterium]|nr:hypothetical protein [Anaerolineae bacterium]HMR63144.1 hypothetical protein [Anaerolineae bacterium]